jgi:hypothetical protein
MRRGVSQGKRLFVWEHFGGSKGLFALPLFPKERNQFGTIWILLPTESRV